MTKRNPVSTEQNIWYNSEQVDAADLTLEQVYNQTVQSAVVANHIGTGVLSESLLPNIIFDSSLETSFLDGVIVAAQAQPSDNNYGNQLEINLSDSKVFGKRTVKIAVIGLDFQQNLQYETFVFNVNESQYTKKHYTSVLMILINDFSGQTTQSFNLGGRILIKEASPYTLSRSTISISQNTQPNLFFRDFYSSTYGTISALLQAGLPNYNIDNLNIMTSELDNKVIYPNDVTTQIGQKFLSNTNNIQKVTLLLSAVNTDTATLGSDPYAWTGELVISIYPLQTSVQCSSDIVPNTLIEFPLNATPLVQLSTSLSALALQGYSLNDVPQPIDFVFSNTSVANGNSIVPGSYYAVTIKRSGSPDKGNIFISAGSDLAADSRLTVFNGNLWVDVPEQDLWFEIHSDSAKVTDGQAYSSGNGLLLSKTTIDHDTGSTIDNSIDNIYFATSNLYTGVVLGSTQNGTPVQDLRTGASVYSTQEVVPEIKLLSATEVSTLQQSSVPLLIGNIIDKNKKFSTLTDSFSAKLYTFSFMENEILIKVVDDTSDPRYDADVLALVSKLFSGDLVDAKIYPNYISFPNNYFRIASAENVTMLYGDVNGDGIVDESDVTLLNTYYGFNFNNVPKENSTITTNFTTTTTFTNGYLVYKSPFSSSVGLSFQIVNPISNAIIASASDGKLVADPNDPRLANFSSLSVNFYSLGVDNYTAIGGYKLVILSSTPENTGGFDILGLDNINNTISIRKTILNSSVIGQLFRADIDGDYEITNQDSVYLRNYVSKYSFNTALPVYSKIGTSFQVIKLKLEEFLDRSDDNFTGSLGSRNADLHPVQDIWTSDGYLYPVAGSPFEMFIQNQFTWKDYLVVSNSSNKLIATIFDESSKAVQNNCELVGVVAEPYHEQQAFDPGGVDSFVPNNLIIGGGQILRSDKSLFKVDFEVGTVILEIPPGMYGLERKINVFDDLISDYTGTGLTRLGFPAMRFADCSTVSSNALQLNQVRISVTVQSFSPNGDGYIGTIVDGKMGVYVEQETGLVSLNFTNLYQDEVLRTLSTKLELKVYLKKAGFNNKPIFVGSDKVLNLLGLIKDYLGTGKYPGDEGSPTATSIVVGSSSLSPLSGSAVPSYFTVNVPAATTSVSVSAGTGVDVAIYSYDLVTSTTTLLTSGVGSASIGSLSLALGQNGIYVTTGSLNNLSAYQIIINRTI